MRKIESLSYIAALSSLSCAFAAVYSAPAVADETVVIGHVAPLTGPVAQLGKDNENGARLAVEGLAKGESLNGKRVVIVEDVTTTGGSALKAVEAVREAGGQIALVFTMVDREEGAGDTFAAAGIAFRSLYKAGEFLKG